MGVLEYLKGYISEYIPPKGSRPYVGAAAEGGFTGITISTIAQAVEIDTGRMETASDIRIFGVLVAGVKGFAKVGLDRIIEKENFNARESVIRELVRFGATVGSTYASQMAKNVNELRK